MFTQIVDLHIHSKYSRACSPQLDIPHIAQACNVKGIDIVSTGDFTHPAWAKHLGEQLEETSSGMYEWRERKNLTKPVRFVLGTEISCIYSHKDKTRRLHLLVFAPSLDVAARFTAKLVERGVNITADGRPIMGLSGKEIVQICVDTDPGMFVVPAHAWTPWFAVFGSKSGYDSLEECFEELAPHITAIETGLSSDPTMNHRLSALDTITLISNSDAHSLDKLGREANVLSFKDEKDVTYAELKRIITTGDRKQFLSTIEFYPEEGKYHVDGHADCKIALEPEESKLVGLRCPTCKKPLTIGVLHRVAALADRKVSEISEKKFIPHRYIVPLREIIATAFDVGTGSKRVATEYDRITSALGSEFNILLEATEEEIKKASSDPRLALGIMNMRAGKVAITPGYDGIFGTVDVFSGAQYHTSVQKSLL